VWWCFLLAGLLVAVAAAKVELKQTGSDCMTECTGSCSDKCSTDACTARCWNTCSIRCGGGFGAGGLGLDLGGRRSEEKADGAILQG
jgi:hypothetical protein